MTLVSVGSVVRTAPRSGAERAAPEHPCVCHDARVCAHSMDHGDRLLRIGTFSTLSRISVRMLRYYQAHDVLAPARTDPFSGYRYYRADQLVDAHLVVQLRDAGFPVASIAQIVASTDPTGVEAAIAAQRAELLRRQDALRGQLLALDRVSTTLRGPLIMTDVTIATLPQMTVAGLRRIISDYNAEGVLWQEIMPLLEKSGTRLPGGGIGGATYHDADYREADVDVEVWLQVCAPFDAAPPLECRTLPTQRIVTTPCGATTPRCPRRPRPSAPTSPSTASAPVRCSTSTGSVRRRAPIPAAGSPTSASRSLIGRSIQ